MESTGAITVFTFKVVDNQELMDEVFCFRYEIMHGELKFIDANKKKMDVDVYDRHAVHFVALNDRDSVCATIRLIYNSPIGYPVENNMELNIDVDALDRLKFAELSRAFIAKDIRSVKNTKYILDNFKKLMIHPVREHGIEYMFAALEVDFLNLNKRILKMNFQKIGEPTEYVGFRYPCLLKTEDLVRDNPFLIELEKVLN